MRSRADGPNQSARLFLSAGIVRAIPRAPVGPFSSPADHRSRAGLPEPVRLFSRAIESGAMDENPYTSPVELAGPTIVEPQGWPAKLRHLALGPRLLIAWVVVVAGLVGLVAVMVLFGHIAAPR